MTNAPAKYGDLVAFRENIFPVQIQFEDSALITEPVVVELWNASEELYATIVPTVTGDVIEFSISVDQLRDNPRGGDVYVKFDGSYDGWMPLKVTMDGSVSQPRLSKVTYPSVGTIRVSTYSDFASVAEAEAIWVDIETKQGEINVVYDNMQGVITTPEMKGAIGDGVTNDNTAVNNAFAEEKEVYLKSLYLANGFTNLKGSPVTGTGGIIKDVPGGGKTQFTTDLNINREFNHNNLWCWYNSLSKKTGGKVIFEGDSTTFGSNTTTGNNITSIFIEALAYFGVTNVTVVNDGVGGAHEGSWVGAKLASQLAQNPKLLVVGHGINSVDTSNGRTIDDFISTYRSALTQARDTANGGKAVKDMSILICTPQSAIDAVRTRDRRVFEKMRRALFQMAVDFQCAICDIYGYTWDSYNKYLAGYDQIGGNVYDNIHGDDSITHIRGSAIVDFCIPTTFGIRLLARVSPTYGGAGKNQYDVSTSIDGYSLNGGVVTVNANTSYSPNYIPVVPGQIWTGKDGNGAATRFITYYDAAKAYVSQVTTQPITFKIPAGVYFMRVSVQLTGKASYQLELSPIPTTYEAYINQLLTLDGSLINGATNLDRAVWNSKFGVSTVKIVPTTTNYFNKATTVPGYSLLNGLPVVNATYSYSDYIETAGSQRWRGGVGTTNGTGLFRWVEFSDENKVWISDITTSTDDFTTPSTARYIRVSITTSVLDTVHLEKGATKLPYVSYIGAIQSMGGYGVLPALGRYDFSALPAYADDTAAAAAGLPIGFGYFASGVLKRREV